MPPSISIVTPTFNQGQYIEQTINSVLDQRYPNLQYIIVDGGSTDDSVNIIKKYERHLAWWVSGKDRGQADAINKGFSRCTGEIFNWLNSDDYLQADALQKIATAFNDQKVDLVAGKVNNFSANKNEIVTNQYLSPVGLMRWDKDVQFIQPGVWMRRTNFINCGGVNERFHYSFDWDLLIRYLYFYPKVKYLDDVLVNFRLHDESKTVSSLGKFAEEEKFIIEELYNNNRFTSLHPVCKWKMDRSRWTGFLRETANAANHSKLNKVYTILTRLNKQPSDAKITRMTLGAIKKILLS